MGELTIEEMNENELALIGLMDRLQKVIGAPPAELAKTKKHVRAVYALARKALEAELAETISHISGGTVKIRMSASEKQRCEQVCAEVGDAPCWRLPSKTSSWPKGQAVTACDDCKDATDQGDNDG